jgi:hypothetical protein
MHRVSHHPLLFETLVHLALRRPTGIVASSDSDDVEKASSMVRAGAAATAGLVLRGFRLGQRRTVSLLNLHNEKRRKRTLSDVERC